MNYYLICALVVAFGTTGYWFSRIWVKAHNLDEAKNKRRVQLERDGEIVVDIFTPDRGMDK